MNNAGYAGGIPEEKTVLQTYGLTHISLAVREPERSLEFSEQVFGVREYHRDEQSIHEIEIWFE